VKQFRVELRAITRFVYLVSAENAEEAERKVMEDDPRDMSVQMVEEVPGGHAGKPLVVEESVGK
jgi:hypothetical protein